VGECSFWYRPTRVVPDQRPLNGRCCCCCCQCFDAVGWAAGRASGLKKTEWWDAGVVICLKRGADLHMAQLMPLPLTVSCVSKIQIGSPFLYRLTWVAVKSVLLLCLLFRFSIQPDRKMAILETWYACLAHSI